MGPCMGPCMGIKNLQCVLFLLKKYAHGDLGLRGHVSIIKGLLDRPTKGDMSQAQVEKDHLLVIYASCGNLERVDLFLRLGANPLFSHGLPLLVAIAHGCLLVVKEVITHATTIIDSHILRLAIKLAMAHGYSHIVQYLAKHECCKLQDQEDSMCMKPRNDKNLLLAVSASSQDIALMEDLITQKAQPLHFNGVAILLAIQTGNMAITRSMIQNACYIYSHNMDKLLEIVNHIWLGAKIARVNGHIEVADFVLKCAYQVTSGRAFLKSP
jgi:hypothetical protein